VLLANNNFNFALFSNIHFSPGSMTVQYRIVMTLSVCDTRAYFWLERLTQHSAAKHCSKQSPTHEGTKGS
jgi:hypothetical protein